jgi:hypothetical protein
VNVFACSNDYSTGAASQILDKSDARNKFIVEENFYVTGNTTYMGVTRRLGPVTPKLQSPPHEEDFCFCGDAARVTLAQREIAAFRWLGCCYSTYIEQGT